MKLERNMLSADYHLIDRDAGEDVAVSLHAPLPAAGFAFLGQVLEALELGHQDPETPPDSEAAWSIGDAYWHTSASRLENALYREHAAACADAVYSMTTRAMKLLADDSTQPGQLERHWQRAKEIGRAEFAVAAEAYRTMRLLSWWLSPQDVAADVLTVVQEQIDGKTHETLH